MAGKWPDMAQPWSGMNGRETETQLAYHIAYNSVASSSRDCTGSRVDNLELADHSGPQNSFLSSQTATDDVSLKVTHSFLPLGQHFLERRPYINKVSNLENEQSTPYPTVIRSQPRNQPLNLEDLFSGSATRFETTNAASVEKEQSEESSLAGQNVLYNYVQNMKLAYQNQEIMPQGQSSQNQSLFGGQNLSNIQGGFVHQTGLETVQYLQQQVLYQQYMQEMQRQQQNLLLDQHAQWYRQQQSQLFWAAQNKSFESQFSPKQDPPKVGGEGWQLPYQTPFHQPQGFSGNVYLPGPSSSPLRGEINEHPLGLSKSPQELASETSSLGTSVVNHSSGHRRDIDLVVSENSLRNEQPGSDYHSGGVEEHVVEGPFLSKRGFQDFRVGTNMHPEVTFLKSSPYNFATSERPQLYQNYHLEQAALEVGYQSADAEKNVDNYYEEDLKSSGQFVDYPVRQQQTWAGPSEQYEEGHFVFCPQSNPGYALQSSVIHDHFEKQNSDHQLSSAQSGSELLVRNQRTVQSAPQFMEQDKMQVTELNDLNTASLRQECSLNLQGIHHQFPVHHGSIDSARAEAQEQTSWSNLLRRNGHNQSGDLHQTEFGQKQQAVWNDVGVRNGSLISGSSLCLFSDIDGRQSMIQSDADLEHDLQVLKKAADERQVSESGLLEGQGSLPTDSSFLPDSCSAEKPDDNWTAHGYQCENDQMVNHLEAFLEFDEKLDELTNQQLLQDAIGNDDPSTDMEWHHQVNSWKQTLQHGLHGISPNHVGELEGGSQIDQVSDRMQMAAFPREVAFKKFMEQADSHLQAQGSDLGANLEGFKVHMKLEEKRQSLQDNTSGDNSHDFTQVKPWMSQNADSKQDYSGHLWSLQLSNAVDGLSASQQKGASTMSTSVHGGSKGDFAFQNLDKREKLLNVRQIEPGIPPKNNYFDFTNQSKMNMLRNLNPHYPSKSVSSSTTPMLSLNLRNLVPDWYSSEMTRTADINLDQMQYEGESQQLLSQQNGQKSLCQKQTNFVAGPSQSKEKTYLMRTNILPEADLRNVSFDDAVDMSFPAASPCPDRSQSALLMSSYKSAPRETLQLLNKPRVPEGLSLPIEANQQSSKHGSRIHGDPGHGLSVSQHSSASVESGGARLAHQEFSVDTFSHDATSAFQPTSVTAGPSLWPPVTNHALPFLDSTSCGSSHFLISERGFAREKPAMERTAVHFSSPLVKNTASSFTVTSVASQDYVTQKKMDAIARSRHQSKLSNDGGFPKVMNNLWHLMPDQQRPSLQKEGSVSAVSESLAAAVPRREVRLDSLSETNHRMPPKAASFINAEGIAHSGPRMGIKTLGQATLAGDSSRLFRNMNDSIIADRVTSTVSLAQSRALEDVCMSTQGLGETSYPQSSSSEVQIKQAHLESLSDQPPNMQAAEQHMNFRQKNSTPRVLNSIENAADLASSSHTDSTTMQHSNINGSLDGKGNHRGMIDNHRGAKKSNATPRFAPVFQDSRVSQHQPSTEMSLVTPSKCIQPGPNPFSNQRLLTAGQLLQHSLESQKPSQLPPHKSSQGHSQMHVLAGVAQSLEYAEKSLISSSIKKQARTLSNSSNSRSEPVAEQSAVMSKKSEGREPTLFGDNRLDSGIKHATSLTPVKKSSNIEKSSSKSLKTVQSPSFKRKKESSPLLMPWRMAISQSAALLPTPSVAELQWAVAVNRVPERDDEGMDLRDENLQFHDRAKQRLRLTTQLMQTVVTPAPASLVQSKSADALESATFTIAKVLLGDACSLVGGEGWQNDKPFREDKGNCCNSSEWASKNPKAFPWGSSRHAAAIKLVDDFKRRVKRLDDCLSRLESLPSASEVISGIQEVDKLLVKNRLLDRHFEDFAVEDMDSLSEGKPIATSSHGSQRLMLRKYVTPLPMPSKLPEGTQLLSL